MINHKNKKRIAKAERLKVIKQNNDTIVNVMKAVIKQSNIEKNRRDHPYKQEVYSNKIFDTITEILK